MTLIDLRRLFQVYGLIISVYQIYITIHYRNYVSKKEATWCLIITLANVNRFSSFFHQLIPEIFSCTHIHTNFHLTCDVLLHYLMNVENPKCYWFWQHPQQTVGMFLRTLWTLDLTFDVVRQTVSRLLTLTDWLTLWSVNKECLRRIQIIFCS